MRPFTSANTRAKRPPNCRAVDRDAGEQPDAGLNRPADQVWLGHVLGHRHALGDGLVRRGLGFGVVHLAFEGDGAIDLRLTGHLEKQETQEPSQDADQHPTDQQTCDHRTRSPSVAGEAEKMPAVVHELMHIHAAHQ